jgi:predicted helicase
MFPTPRHGNIFISSTGVADRKGYSALVTDHVPNMHLTDTGQCFPLYWYERVDEVEGEPQTEMFVNAATPDADGYIRRDAISDWALGEYRRRYSDDSITKEDIFWYVYGILHSPEYKDRFAADLKKMVPRIPFAADFVAFRDAGRDLGRCHLDYETVEPWPLEEEMKRLVMEPADWRVHKMVFGKRGGAKDRSTIVYNANVVLKGIPEEAYDYVVNGKSAIEWVTERYAVTVHKESGIRNDPNDWSDDPRYIVDLLKRIVRVSMETVRIVRSLPPLGERA